MSLIWQSKLASGETLTAQDRSVMDAEINEVETESSDSDTAAEMYGGWR